MRRSREEDAVSIIIFVLLMFGILVSFLAIQQSVTVPDQNLDTEFEHSQEVQSQMIQLRNTVQSVSKTGISQSTKIKLGTRYRLRPVLQNPLDPWSRLSNSTMREIIVSNTTALNPETSEYWDGENKTFETEAISNEPSYNIYQSAPTVVYENSVVYNNVTDSEGTVGVAVLTKDQEIIDGKYIDIVAVKGNVDMAGRGVKSLTVSPGSQQVNTVRVKGEGDKRITLYLPTRLSEDKMDFLELLRQQVFEDELTPKGHVIKVQLTADKKHIKIVLEKDQIYYIRLSTVTVGV
ncbi:MAG: hypothetical protein ABEK59_04850 [Halobacteria archaeon]